MPKKRIIKVTRKSKPIERPNFDAALFSPETMSDLAERYFMSKEFNSRVCDKILSLDWYPCENEDVDLRAYSLCFDIRKVSLINEFSLREIKRMAYILNSIVIMETGDYTEDEKSEVLTKFAI